MSSFERTALLLGDDALAVLKNASVAIFGIGGVGASAAEGIARAGVGRITLVDGDVVSQSNINRQLIATTKTIGMVKAQVMAERIAEINPSAQVTALERVYTPENAHEFGLASFDFVIDAIDSVSAKADLIVQCFRLNVPIISCMGAGNRLDPTRFRVDDIFRTHGCGLARVMRKKLRAEGVSALKVVWSQEPPLTPLAKIKDGGRLQLPGSVPFVPPVAGFIAAGEAVKHIVGV